MINSTLDKPVATLADIIASADGINKTVISRAELEIGFTHLIKAGHLKKVAGGFVASDAVWTFWKAARGGLYKKWDALKAFIGVPETAPEHRPETKKERYVTRAKYAATLETYWQGPPPPMTRKRK